MNRRGILMEGGPKFATYLYFRSSNDALERLPQPKPMKFLKNLWIF